MGGVRLQATTKGCMAQAHFQVGGARIQAHAHNQMGGARVQAQAHTKMGGARTNPEMGWRMGRHSVQCPSATKAHAQILGGAGTAHQAPLPNLQLAQVAFFRG